MVKHTHKAGESLIGMPEEILIWYDGYFKKCYLIGCFDGTVYDCGGGVTFDDSDDFRWYDLTELGE